MFSVKIIQLGSGKCIFLCNKYFSFAYGQKQVLNMFLAMSSSYLC